MTAPSDIASPRNFAAGIGSVLRLVVPLPCATGNDRKPAQLPPRSGPNSKQDEEESCEYCAKCGSDQMPMGDDSCRDCGKLFYQHNADVDAQIPASRDSESITD